MSKEVVLEKLVTNQKRVDFYFNVKGGIQKYFKKSKHLFFKYNLDIEEVPTSILTIPFIANIIPLVWLTNSKIIVPELDRAFYDCLPKLKEAYQDMFPEVKLGGEISVSSIIENSYTPDHEAAQLFSGGLDALATFVRIREKKPILITEFGWHKDHIENSEVWIQDMLHVTEFGKRKKLSNMLIESNYGTFLNASIIDRDFAKKLGDSWWHGLHHSLAIISAAIPSAFLLKVECVYIASSFFEGFKAKCASDPTVDNQIRFASGRVFHDGYELNRQDKVGVLVNYCKKNNEYEKLRVCFLKENNCCNCEKCIRTMVGIIGEGENPEKFGFVTSTNLSTHIKVFLEENVKYFNGSKIMQWNLAKYKMRENRENIQYQDLLEWFLNYDFALERKKSLIKYRITKFIPIIKRRIYTKLTNIFVQNT
ncbi:peptidase [Jeotgalibacillus sp. ET6]|uniref:peptidase n=1 Tax=Jeotgalibacillus sp. ET6 TaxID=3037260 RepID=UPI0024186762|nr:peptidase [Jeotgalibacillus sp. ET6]MDG5472616.1 peptidase [Jeotgalibacillus sp. ET6]